MKKFGIFCAALLSLGLVACDDKSDLGVMQVNPQEAVMSAGGVTVAYQGGFEEKALNINTHAGEQLPVLTYTLADDYQVPEGSSIYYRLEMAANQAFEGALSMNLESVDGVEVADATKLNDMYVSLFGRSPMPNKAWVRVAGYMVTGQQVVRLGGVDQFYGQEEITITPIDLNLPIETSYYLTTSALSFATNVGDDMKFVHGDKHPYDDPKFSIAFTVTDDDLNAGNFKWLVVPDSQRGHDLAGTFGVDANAATAMKGVLVENGEGGVPGEIAVAGSYLLTVNMEDLTYTLNFANDYFWAIGTYNGMVKNETNMRLYTHDYINYSGYLPITGFWQLSAEANGTGLQVKYAGSGNGVILGGGGRPFNLPEEGAGAYWVDVNLAESIYTTAKISTLGVIGGFNNWAGDAEMTPDAKYRTWTAEVTFDEPGEWKIRANGDWAISFGYQLDDTQYNGGNFQMEEAGTYRITIDFSTLPYKTTVTKL